MKQDTYVNEMDWANHDVTLSDLTNYRKYQYSLIANFIGENILEVGSGDRGFTNLITRHKNNINRIISIEPSETLFSLWGKKYSFPDHVKFLQKDLFELTGENHGYFDTIIFIHVLEHIEKDRDALNKAYELLLPNGHVLIEVPALQFLFSQHDEKLGHYRRYNKSSMKAIIDLKKFEIVDIWYQDFIGVFGSLYYFKLRKIKLKSESGINLVKNQGKFYDEYLIPFQSKIEKYIRFPLGLSLTVILKKL